MIRPSLINLSSRRHRICSNFHPLGPALDPRGEFRIKETISKSNNVIPLGLEARVHSVKSDLPGGV